MSFFLGLSANRFPPKRLRWDGLPSVLRSALPRLDVAGRPCFAAMFLVHSSTRSRSRRAGSLLRRPSLGRHASPTRIERPGPPDYSWRAWGAGRGRGTQSPSTRHHSDVKIKARGPARTSFDATAWTESPRPQHGT